MENKKPLSCRECPLADMYGYIDKMAVCSVLWMSSEYQVILDIDKIADKCFMNRAKK